MDINSVKNLSTINRIGQQYAPSTRYISKTITDSFERKSDLFNQNLENNDDNTHIARKYNTAVDVLNTMNNKAERDFKSQLAMDGWSAKLGEKICSIFGSKKTSTIIEKDIKTNKAEIEHLKKAAMNGTFEDEFKDIFGVKYDKNAVNEFKTVSEKYALVESSQKLADNTKTTLTKYIDFFEENKKSINPESEDFDRYKKTQNIDEKLNKYEQTLYKYTGGKENFDKLAAARRKDFATLSREDRLDVYNDIANGLIYTTEKTAEALKHGKTDNELKKEYDLAYEKAFGTKNNIQKKVADYILTQQIRSIAVKDIAVSGIVGAAIATSGTTLPALTGAAVTTFSYMGMDTLDLATNNIDDSLDLTNNSVKEIVKYSLIYGAEYFVGSKLYDIVPTAETGNKVLNGVLDVARTTGIELSTAFVSEYLETGEWGTDQITPKALVGITLATYGTEELLRMGLSAPSGLKHQYTPKLSGVAVDAADFSKRAMSVLEKQFKSNPASVMNLKLLSVENAELFNTLLTATLQQAI